jgi:hypothetical protein
LEPGTTLGEILLDLERGEYRNQDDDGKRERLSIQVGRKGENGMSKRKKIGQQKEATADNQEEKYQATQNLDRICKDFRDGGLSF